jgi:Mg2+-importing ATPase
MWSTVAVCAATLAIPYLGPPSAAFGFVPLSALQMLTVLIIVVGYIAATEMAKTRFFRGMT